ncbi:hypothetical protein K431DRAFT_228490 [Polychaeton citri CBS 116435]|uniref:Uncharacterized protein n=1 Tax=Polychaeton citri CBS 116435 TaxID=1314669 RepID=A0A9P4Q4S6_9PEZI|nr:hypothetical protein K431DRAFT_228490 [Polychaeton citri CBS 116435]
MSAPASAESNTPSPPPDTQPKRPKSPPLAFEPTPNDSLAPLRSPQNQEPNMSPSIGFAGFKSPPIEAGDGQGLQVIIDQQSAAIRLLHDAFAAERQVWNLEKERLHQRIASLEKLLKTGNGYSPAKSPVISPLLSNLCSPTSAPRGVVGSNKLPSIAEDGGIKPMSLKRDGVPNHIALPDGQQEEGLSPGSQKQRRSSRQGSVSFGESAPIIIEEIPLSRPETARRLSPPPPEYREHAGHTPLQAPRRPTPPPKALLSSLEGIDDTPTRNNTHLNNFLTQSTDDEEDFELRGPLNMPELPHMPEATNFTIEMLSKKLQQIEQNPERNKPLVFSTKSPGLASPERRLSNDHSLGFTSDTIDGAVAPAPTTKMGGIGSQATSNAPGSAASPNGAPLSQVQSRESQLQEDLAHGGIRLKKKPSTNFGSPFGVLGGYGSVRKNSDLD